MRQLFDGVLQGLDLRESRVRHSADLAIVEQAWVQHSDELAIAEQARVIVVR